MTPGRGLFGTPTASKTPPASVFCVSENSAGRESDSEAGVVYATRSQETP